MMRKPIVALTLIAASVADLTSGFTISSAASASPSASTSPHSSPDSIRSSTLRHLFDSEQEQSDIVGDGSDDVTFESSELYQALNKRKRDIKRGIGKRYAVCTQKGFLNIHADPRSGPFATDNIVGKLEDGDIVTSVAEPFGTWIQHDGGGWSISKFEGFTWLKPFETEDLD